MLVQTTVPGEGDTSFQVFQSAQSGIAANSATMTVRLEEDADLVESTTRLTAALEPVKSDGYDVIVGSAGGFSSNGLTVVVSGPDPVEVEEASVAVLAALEDTPGVINLKSDLVKATPEIQVTVDPNKAITRRASPRPRSPPRSARRSSPTTATTVTFEPGKPISLIVQVDPAATTSVDDLEALPVGTARTVPLGDVATVEQVDVQGSITRIDEAPAASINGEITSDDTGAVSQSVQTEIDALEANGQIPAGVTVELAGVSQQQAEAFGGLFASMAVAILLVYLMMVLAFNSLITPFVILFTLPLATIGAFPALYLTGRPIGISALIGFLMLIGIVVTNAIVLLDLVERLRKQGYSVHARADRGWPDPCPADPDDRHRHDPGARAARRGLQQRIDHRRRARHRRHRRPVQRDVPDADRRSRSCTRSWRACAGVWAGAAGAALRRWPRRRRSTARPDRGRVPNRHSTSPAVIPPGSSGSVALGRGRASRRGQMPRALALAAANSSSLRMPWVCRLARFWRAAICGSTAGAAGAAGAA